MSETLLIAIIVALTSMITAGITASVFWYVAIRKTPKELKVLDAQGTLDIAGSFKSYAEALDTIVKTVLATNKDLEVRVDELEAHRTQRGRQIYELQQTIEQLKVTEEIRDREYVKETQSLRTKIADFEKKNVEYRRIIEQLLEILQKIDPKLLEGIDLTDTLRKIQAIK